jgi:uncharacterized tellurite resistance protein B-like protein
MSDRDLILTLAKVIIAAAWADGEVTREEINSLKDLLFHLPRTGYKQGPQVTGKEWAMLEMYMETPVNEAERRRLVEELKGALRTPRDRELALTALEELVWADGVVSEEERTVMEEIRSAIASVDLGILAQVGRLITGPLQRRAAATAAGPNREADLEDFIKNRVYFAVKQHLQSSDGELNIDEAELRKLSLAGALLARVAHSDRSISDEEFDATVAALQTGWGVKQEAAAFVAEIAVSQVSAGVDYFRLTREFTTSTTNQERRRFLDVLFAVASADGEISFDETEEIREIAYGLNLSRRQFINAKVDASAQTG